MYDVRRSWPFALFAVLLTGPALAGTEEPPRTLRYDVAVYGATEGGIGAALQAARLGARVALVEETDYIGGMTAAGVPNMDGNGGYLATGLYGELVDRVRARYELLGRSIDTCYPGTRDAAVCFEPRVARQVMEEMLIEARADGTLDLFLLHRPVEVHAEDGRVVAVTTHRGVRFEAAVTIDATELGDVLALSPARYRIGNATSDDPDPEDCLQDITYVAVVRRYDRVPAELRMPADPPPPGYTDELAARFARLVIPDGNRGTPEAPFPVPVDWPSHVVYRGLPDSSSAFDYANDDPAAITKTALNWANDYPSRVGWLEPDELQPWICRAQLRTLQFLHYVQHELGESSWSVADDEGYDTWYNRHENRCPELPEAYAEIVRHFPLRPYIRESRRLVGVETVTGPMLRRDGQPRRAAFVPTAIAVGTYGTDLHRCSHPESLEAELGDTPEAFSDWGLVQVPLGVLIPETIDGFLVGNGKLMSVSRIANGALRHQPISMLVGQAAGALAGLAVRVERAPREVDYRRVQDVLLRAGSMLAPLTDVDPDSESFPAIERAVLDDLIGEARPLRFQPERPATHLDLARGLASAMALDLDASEPTDSFTDLPADHPGNAPVAALQDAGAWPRERTETGLAFQPGGAVTRLELAEHLLGPLRSLGLTRTVDGEPSFVDVGADHPGAEAVEAAVRQGFAISCRRSRFCPGESVTRAELARALVHLAALVPSSGLSRPASPPESP